MHLSNRSRRYGLPFKRGKYLVRMLATKFLAECLHNLVEANGRCLTEKWPKCFCVLRR